MLKMTSNILSELISHAKKDMPFEACGYLAEKDGIIIYHYPMKNADASNEHYSLDPAEQFDTLRDMREKGLDLAAVYHSHPNTPARPSQEDIRLAYDPDLSYVIISLANGDNDVRSFKIRDNHVVPEEIEIVNP